MRSYRTGRTCSRSPRGSSRRSPPAGRAGGGLRHQRAAERQQQQERGHGPGASVPARRAAAGALLLQRGRRLFLGPGFLAARRAIHHGRGLRRAERYCVVDEDFARRYWPKNECDRPAGLRRGFSRGQPREAYTVVGVVGPVKQAGLASRRPRARSIIRSATGSTTTFGSWSARVCRRNRSGRRCAGPSGRSIPSCRSTISARWRLASPTASYRGARRPCWREFSPLCPAPHRHWHLRSVELRRGPAPPRDRRAHRAGSPARADSRPVPCSALRLLAAGTVWDPGAWLTGRAMQHSLRRTARSRGDPRRPAAILGLVTFLACLVPSHRAARISPMEAMIEE